MPRPARRTANSVSLFPFLAVLVCAMGALIFLLIVTTRRIRDEALAKAEQRDSADVGQVSNLPELEPPLPEEPGRLEIGPTPLLAAPPPVDLDIALRETIARLQRQRDAHRRRLDEDMAAISDALREVGGTETRLHGLQRQLDQAKRQRERDEQAEREIASRQAALALEITETGRLLQHAAEANSLASSKYAIVPFDGGSGTTRRPIFIECTSRGLRFLPEDILLTADDLEGFTPGFNPALAGARSLIDYWSDRSRAGDDEPKPYVLLLVRPSGSIAYYAARKALSRLNQPSGYELLEEDWPLELPAPDPQAREVCRSAISRVLAERRHVIKSLMADRGTGGRVVRLHPGTGSFEVIDREPEARLEDPFSRDPTGSAPFGGREFESGSPTSEFRGSRSAAQSPWAAPRGNSARAGDDSPDSPLIDPHSGIAMPHAAATSPHREGEPGGLSIVPRAPSLVAPPGSPLTIAREGRDDAESGSLQPGAPRQAPDRDPQSRDFNSQARGTGQSRRDDGTLTAEEPQAAGGEPQAVPRDFPPIDSGNQWQTARSGRETTGRPAAPGARHSPATQTDPRSAAGSPPSSFAAPRFPEDSEMPLPTFGASFGTKAPDSVRSSLRRRWGFSSPAATIGFEREVQIEVEPHRMIVARGDTIPLGNGETREQMAGQLLAALEKEARSWGHPPEGFYWVPTIRFVVSPGGNQHHERLKQPLETWGLGSRVEFRVGTEERGLQIED